MIVIHEYIKVASEALRVASHESRDVTPMSSSEISSMVIELSYAIEWLDSLLTGINHKLDEVAYRGGVIVNHDAHDKTIEEVVDEAGMLLTISKDKSKLLSDSLMLCAGRLATLKDIGAH